MWSLSIYICISSHSELLFRDLAVGNWVLFNSANRRDILLRVDYSSFGWQKNMKKSKQTANMTVNIWLVWNLFKLILNVIEMQTKWFFRSSLVSTAVASFSKPRSTCDNSDAVTASQMLNLDSHCLRMVICNFKCQKLKDEWHWYCIFD